MMDGSILIVSASTGTGHLRAAEAVHAELRAREPGLGVEQVDLLDLAPRWVRAAYGNGYELIATKTPRLWRQIYRRTDLPTPELARWGPAIHRVMFGAFRRLLLSRRWSVCLCTHFLPGQLAAGTNGSPPFAMVITDRTLHHFWAQPRVGRYFVAADDIAAELRCRLPNARIDATGIPISPRFAERPARDEARRALGLDTDRSVVVVMGGGLGLGVDVSAEASLAASIPGLQVVALCGRNAEARSRLEMHPAVATGRFHVIEHVPDVERYMAAADVVVTKPGGLSTSEVLAVGVPMILTRAIPGQEEGNTRVLVRQGAAIEAPVGRDVTAALERVFGNADLFRAMQVAADRLGRPRASGDIAATVLREYVVRAAA